MNTATTPKKTSLVFTQDLSEEQQKAIFKEHRKRLNEYMRENPLKEEVVKKLFDAFDKLLNAPTAIPMARSLICFNMKLDPLKYVDEREFQMGVYDPLIDSFHQTYIEKWKKDIEEYYGH